MPNTNEMTEAEWDALTDLERAAILDDMWDAYTDECSPAQRVQAERGNRS